MAIEKSSERQRANVTKRKQTGPRWRGVALPAEHGSWGLVVEPLLLGLLVAFSSSGALFAVAAFAGFLLHRPLKLLLVDWQRGRWFRRTFLARRFALLYGGISLAALSLFIWQVGLTPLWPTGAALPLLAIFVAYDVWRPGRSWQAELAAPVAFGATAAVIALVGGVPAAPAVALWAALVARAVPSILYVRARLRLEKEKAHNPWLVVAAHVVALTGTGALIAVGRLPLLAGLPFVILLGRAAVGLSPYRRPLTVKQIGFLEMGLGLLTVLVIALGYV